MKIALLGEWPGLLGIPGYESSIAGSECSGVVKGVAAFEDFGVTEPAIIHFGLDVEAVFADVGVIASFERTVRELDSWS